MKIYSFPAFKLSSDLVQSYIAKSVMDSAAKFEAALFLDGYGTQKGMSEQTRKIVECPACPHDFSDTFPCESCGNRDLHPIPMSELYALSRLLET